MRTLRDIFPWKLYGEIEYWSFSSFLLGWVFAACGLGFNTAAGLELGKRWGPGMLCVSACRCRGRYAVTSAATANEVMMVMAVAAAAASATASHHQGYADGQVHIVVLLAHLRAVYGTVCPVNLNLLIHLEARGTCSGVLS